MNYLSRNLVIFLLACGLGVGAILVYTKNNMASQNSNTAGSNLTEQTNTQNTSGQNNDQVLSTQVDTVGSNQQQAQSQPQAQNQATAQQAPQQAANPLPTGPITELMIRDIAIGNGQEVKAGDTVDVHYTGTFLDGQKFDSSVDRGQPFSFTVGAGQVIKGWDQGLIGMKTGGKRQLIIPSDLAYGQAGAPGAIPPNTPLAFDIELVAIKSSQ